MLKLETILMFVVSLVVGVFAFFLKDQKKKYEEADRKNEDKIGRLEEKVNDLKEELPYKFTTKDDYVRTMATLERKIDRIEQSLDEKFERLNKGLGEQINSIVKMLNDHLQRGG